MSDVKQYIRIDNPSKRRTMGGDENFNREAGWIPVPKVEPAPEPKTIEAPKPKQTRKPRTKKK